MKKGGKSQQTPEGQDPLDGFNGDQREILQNLRNKNQEPSHLDRRIPGTDNSINKFVTDLEKELDSEKKLTGYYLDYEKRKVIPVQGEEPKAEKKSRKINPNIIYAALFTTMILGGAAVLLSKEEARGFVDNAPLEGEFTFDRSACNAVVVNGQPVTITNRRTQRTAFSITSIKDRTDAIDPQVLVTDFTGKVREAHLLSSKVAEPETSPNLQEMLYDLEDNGKKIVFPVNKLAETNGEGIYGIPAYVGQQKVSHGVLALLQELGQFKLSSVHTEEPIYCGSAYAASVLSQGYGLIGSGYIDTSKRHRVQIGSEIGKYGKYKTLSLSRSKYQGYDLGLAEPTQTIQKSAISSMGKTNQ